MQDIEIFDMYDKFIKPQEVVEVEEEPDKLFEVEEPTVAETPQVVIPDDMKAALMKELREEILKELEANKSKEE